MLLLPGPLAHRPRRRTYTGSFHHGHRGYAGSNGQPVDSDSSYSRSNKMEILPESEQACADTGAGMNITPMVHRLTNVRPANVRVRGFRGKRSAPPVIGTLGTLKNTLGCPVASTTLVSVGAQVEGTLQCVSFYQDAAYKIGGIVISKNKDGDLTCKIGKNISIQHFADREGPNGIYKIPRGIHYFDKDNKPKVFSCISKYCLHAAGTPQCPWHDKTPRQVELLYSAFELDDYAQLYNFNVDQLTATQHKYALQLLRKHNAYGHLSKKYLRWLLQQSPVKADRDLAKYIDLLPLCNHCLNGHSREHGHSSEKSAAGSDPEDFMKHLSADISGIQNIATSSGFLYFFLIICKKTSLGWLYLLRSPTEAAAVFEKFLRDVARQHLTKRVKTFKSDQGPSDFGNTRFKNLLRKYDITPIETGGSSTHNSKVERRIGLVQTDVLKYMSWASSPRIWWGHCSKYAMTTRNLIPIPTNPGFTCPYEAAYNRAPDRSFQQPFGCLALVNIPRHERGGKLNHRRATRTCAMLGYQLRPDGHPNAYKLFDCDSGQVIIRPKELITFNPDIPAMQHCARKVSDLPDNKFVGEVVAKYFEETQKLHYGRVANMRYDSDSEILWRVIFEDGDKEDYNISEVILYIRLARKHPPPEEVSVPAPRENATTKTLRNAINNSASVDNASIGDAVLQSIRKSASKTSAKSLNSKTSPPTTRDVSPHVRRSSRTRKPTDFTNVSVSGDITNNLHNNRPMFDVNDHHGRRKMLLAWIEHEVDAFGFIVDPPHSNVPKATIAPNTKYHNIPIPKSYIDAVTGPYRDFWIKAIQTEIDNLISRGTWIEVKMPSHARVLKGRYVFKVKPDKDNNIDKFKARWIVQGFRQRRGLDYLKTFASVSNIVTIRLICYIACELDLPLLQCDVTAAYLLGQIEKGVTLYIQTPDGWALDPGIAALLQSGLYGCRQGGNRWAAKRTSTLRSLEAYPSPADPSLYIKTGDNNSFVLVSTVVDDFLMTGQPESYLQSFKSALFQKLAMTGGDEAQWFINLTITRDRTRRLLMLDQSKYADTVLHDFDMSECRDARTPAPEGQVLSKSMCPVTEIEKAKAAMVPYQSILGKLLYFRITRPDIMQIVSKLASYASCWGIAHWKAAKYVLRYIKGTKHFGLLFKSAGKSLNEPWDLEMYVDSDYATDVDTRRSRAGYLIYLNGNLISYRSCLQPGKADLATGTCEAEYKALSLALKELTWVRMVLDTMGIDIKTPMMIWEDNQATIKLTQKSSAAKRTKHIDIRHHFIREFYEEGLIDIKYIPTGLQTADILTKCLGPSLFKLFRDKIVFDRKLVMS